LEAAGVKVAGREAAVLWTGHDLHYDSPDYFWHRPRLSAGGAEWLVARGAPMVAADFPGIGAPNDDRYEVKRILHRGGALTVEQLCNLDKVEGREWTLAAAPLRIRGGTGSPLRAAALVGPPPARLIDLTLDIYKEMPSLGAVPTYWSRATHAITEFFYKGELSYQTTALFLSEHAGTHFDVPYHFDPAGRAMEDFALSELVVPARVLDLTHKRPLEAIGADDLEKALAKSGTTIGPGDGAVVWTGHSSNYYTRDDYTTHRPFISIDGAEWLVAKNPAVVITDLIGLDPPDDLTSPIHNALLGNGLCMLQVLTNLGQLVEGKWRIAILPLNLTGGTGAPLRAFALPEG
jgi:kynurenine formamidase